MLQGQPRKRPPRLLNLNKTLPSNKRVSVNNMRGSPLLALPPEIRSRIWDYVFDIGLVRVNPPLSQGHVYSLSVCQHREMCLIKRRVVYHHPRNSVYTHVSPAHIENHRRCLSSSSRKPLGRHSNLGILQTCRLIYHETVLRPFLANRFRYTVDHPAVIRQKSPFHKFIDRLVPVQARAIKRLQIMSVGGSFLSPTAVKQLRGLEHLDIQIVLGTKITQCLDCFNLDGGVASLPGLPLESCHVSLHSKYVIVTEEDVDNGTLLAWATKSENKILNRVTDDGAPEE